MRGVHGMIPVMNTVRTHSTTEESSRSRQLARRSQRWMWEILSALVLTLAAAALVIAAVSH